MQSHRDIDERALVLAQRIADVIDADPTRKGLQQARQTCRRWQQILGKRERANADEWAAILKQPWEDIRRILLDSGPNSTRLRQNSPFCGILSNQERWRIIKEFASHDARAA